MIRAIIEILILLLFLIFSLPTKWIVFLLRKAGIHSAANRLAYLTAGILFHLLKAGAGVRIILKGEEYLPGPKDDGVLFVGNHCSYFDIVLSFCVFKTCTGYVGKKELGRFPLFNTWMLAIGCVFLDRDNPRDGVRMVQKAIDHISHKNSMVIFPEGTRNKNEKTEPVGTFHQGSLRIAQKSGCKVIPMAITGTADIFENHIPFIRPAKVIIEFAPPLDTASMDKSELKNLANTTHDIILKMRLEHLAMKSGS